MCEPLVEVSTSNSFPMDGFFAWFKCAEVTVLLHEKLCFRNTPAAYMIVGGGGVKNFIYSIQ